MIKKAILLLMVLMPALMQAQLAVGSWEIHKPFTNLKPYDNSLYKEVFVGNRLTDTPNKVYYVSSGSLFSFDKNTEETYVYTSVNKLSDNYVNGMWYNPDGKYLFVAYNNGNIDLIYDDGKIVNLPEIKDALLTSDKTIFDVAFDGNKAYVATKFGLVVFDINKRCVTESGIYNIALATVAVVDGKIVVGTENNDKIYEIYFIDPAAKRLANWNNFTKFEGKTFYGNCLRPLDGNKAIARASYNSTIGYTARLYTFNFDNATLTQSWYFTNDNIDYLQPTASGSYVAVNSKGTALYEFKPDGTYQKTALSAPVSGNLAAFFNSPASLWVGSAKGIGEFDITSSPYTVKHDFALPKSPNVARSVKMKFTPDGTLYNVSEGISTTHNSGYSKGPDYVNRLINGEWENICPDTWCTPHYKGYSPPSNFLGLAVDPENPDVYWVSMFFDGLFKVGKNASTGKWEVLANYDKNNSAIANVDSWGQRSGELAFDKFGNLWDLGICIANRTDYKNILVLPKDKLNSTPNKADWKQIYIPGFNTSYNPLLLMCEHSDFIILVDGEWPSSVVFYDTKGTSDLSDDTYRQWKGFTDQEGKSFSIQNVYSVAEDHDGAIWIGTHNGVLMVRDPALGLDSNMQVNRVKVPRTDGSGFADYLLDSQVVYDIAVDGANNKWFATSNAGLYQVSPQGDKILANFTTENSSLLDNCVFSVACSPVSSSVFASTAYGITEYSGTAAPASENFDNVYAYPNPVRPGYTGWITIKGLMDKTRVKITDAVGNIFFDGISEGGMVVWDGCSNSGQRVKSGVYYVYGAVQDSPESMVTKILVVN